MTNIALDYYLDFKHEKIDGEAVTMSPNKNPNHGRIIGNLFRMFDIHLRFGKCQVFGDGTYVHLSKKDIFVPDLMIICDPEKVTRDGIFGAPDLIAEVISPSSAMHDKIRKKAVYEKYGVREYWIIDADSRTIEVYLLKNGVLMLDTVHTIIPEYEKELIPEEHRQYFATEFKTSLFDDLVISIKEVFERVI